MTTPASHFTDTAETIVLEAIYGKPMHKAPSPIALRIVEHAVEQLEAAANARVVEAEDWLVRNIRGRAVTLPKGKKLTHDIEAVLLVDVNNSRIVLNQLTAPEEDTDAA